MAHEQWWCVTTLVLRPLVFAAGDSAMAFAADGKVVPEVQIGSHRKVGGTDRALGPETRCVFYSHKSSGESGKVC